MSDDSEISQSSFHSTQDDDQIDPQCTCPVHGNPSAYNYTTPEHYSFPSDLDLSQYDAQFPISGGTRLASIETLGEDLDFTYDQTWPIAGDYPAEINAVSQGSHSQTAPFSHLEGPTMNAAFASSSVHQGCQLQSDQHQPTQHHSIDHGRANQPETSPEKKCLPPLTRSRTNARKDKRRHSCTEADCTQDFSRTADLRRHVSDVHRQSDRHYECQLHGCARKTRRRDKIKEHCRKVHKQSKGQEEFTMHLKDGSNG